MHSQDTRTVRQSERLAQIASDKTGLTAHAVARSARALNVQIRADGVPGDPSQLLDELHTAVDQLRSVLLELHTRAGLDPFLGRRVRGYAFGAASLLNDAMISIGLIHSRAGEREMGAVS